MALFGRNYRTALELKSAEFEAFRTQPIRAKREKISICVIDDNIFEPKRNLENTGYKITFLGDINAIERVIPHHIVLCDLQGVGTAFDERKQGAFLIGELKKNYPEKYVVAYTGGGMQQVITREAALRADVLLKKDADMDEWVNTLDKLILLLLTPYEVWQRQRLALVEREVDTLTILKLESAFVESLRSKQHPGASAFERYIDSGEIAGDIRAIVQGMVASGLYALLFNR